MMTKNLSHECKQLEMLTIAQLVPEDHIVRKLKSTIDFSFKQIFWGRILKDTR